MQKALKTINLQKLNRVNTRADRPKLKNHTSSQLCFPSSIVLYLQWCDLHIKSSA